MNCHSDDIARRINNLRPDGLYRSISGLVSSEEFDETVDLPNLHSVDQCIRLDVWQEIFISALGSEVGNGT